ncbi:hypothetical protein [Streptacidiphilus rugosus]|uniref:hypothetical protein n=1 Tax=Streptacidiphilus rugosus TaxID=405783 RepID=UPI0005685A65|nr:hypothetical protein [Streptacidiphilus rugosus]
MHAPRRERTGKLQVRVGRERGSLSLFTAIVILAVLAVLALVVDGGGRLQALAKAEGTAQEAARTGAQSLNAGDALTGHGFTVDHTAAIAAANAYLKAAGVSGTVTTVGNRIEVTVNAPFTPLFPLLGAGTVTGHGSALLLYQPGG